MSTTVLVLRVLDMIFVSYESYDSYTLDVWVTVDTYNISSYVY